MTRTGKAVTENWNRAVIPQRVMDRAYSKTIPSVNGCWISTYSIASHGYAQIGWQGDDKRHVVLAHRAVWERFNGRVPIGMTLDHLCREKRCVNPAHLRLLDNFENARRNKGKDWALGTCANGHPGDLLITVIGSDKQGKPRPVRMCSECRKLYKRRAWWRRHHPGEPMPDRHLLAHETAA